MNRLYSVFNMVTLAVFLLVGTTVLPVAANPKYAAIVIDANSGRTLYASSAEAHRYPASLTKMMTLYMVFDALERGQISRSSRIPISKYAAGRPPSKIGFRPGQTISVEAAIQLLVTKSANDVAAAVGEFLGGTEGKFARKMTRKARQLGMSRTTFRNASGLPNSAQKTTAHDMARLGLALREHFPRYFKYFSTRSYKYGKRRYRNHNRLLGTVKGVDGIKTGYIRASGFNLVTTASRGERRIVAVVMGGKTGKSRNAHMAKLVGKYLPRATKRRGGPLIAKRSTGGAGRKVVSLPRTNAPIPAEKPKLAVASAAGAPTVKRPEPRPEAPQGIDPVTTSSNRVEGWVIQVASMPTESEALSFLDKTKKRAGRTLASASPFTQTFEQNGQLYYRARYHGFRSKSAAWKTCGALKQKKIACYAVLQ